MSFWDNYSDIQKIGTSSGLSGFLGGLFGNSDSGYDKAMEQYKKYADEAAGYQKPFYEAGQSAIPQYKNWINSMKDPSGFMNNLMEQYQESPYAKYLQDQAMKSGMNSASASGLMGSTPFAQEMGRQSAGIASGDMNQWLQKVLGINTQYGAGVGGMMQGGQNAANSLSNIYGNLGNQMGEGAYGRQAGRGQDTWNMLAGAGQLAMFL